MAITVCALVAATVLAGLQTDVATALPVEHTSEQLLRWVADRLSDLDARRQGHQDSTLTLLQSRVASIEIQLSRLETKFDLHMNRLEEVLISRNNIHRQHNENMETKLEVMASSMAPDLSTRMQQLEAQLDSRVARTESTLQESIGKTTDKVDIVQQQLQLFQTNVTTSLELLQRLAESAQTPQVETRDADGSRHDASLACLQTQLDSFQDNVTSDVRIIRQMVEQEEAEHAATRSAVWSGHSATLEAVRQWPQLGRLQAGLERLLRRQCRPAAARRDVDTARVTTPATTHGTATAEQHGSRAQDVLVPGGPAEAASDLPGPTEIAPELVAQTTATQLTEQLDQIATRLLVELRRLNDSVLTYNREHNENLARLASSLRVRLDGVRDHLETATDTIVAVRVAALINATQWAADSHGGRVRPNVLHKIIDGLKHITDVMPRLLQLFESECISHYNVDIDTTLYKEDLDVVAEVTNHGFIKLQDQFGELTTELRQTNGLADKARAKLGRQVSDALNSVSRQLRSIELRLAPPDT